MEDASSGWSDGIRLQGIVVTPDTEGMIRNNQAYAWNPTVAGTKCEETTFLTDNGIEIFTRTKEWPCSVIGTGYGRCSVADILCRSV